MTDTRFETKPPKMPVPLYPKDFYVPRGVPGDRVTPEGHLFNPEQIKYIEQVIKSLNPIFAASRYSKDLFTDEKIIPIANRSGITCNGSLFAILNKDGRQKSAQHTIGSGTFSKMGLKLTFNLKTKKWGILKTQPEIFDKKNLAGKRVWVENRTSEIRNEYAALKRLKKASGHLIFRKPRKIENPSYKLDIFMRYERGFELGHLIYDHLEGQCLMPLAIQLEIAFKLLLAMKKLHLKKIWHCDIKPENIIYDACSGKLALIDLGLALVRKDNATSVVTKALRGTYSFVSPSFVQTFKYHAKDDVYSAGVTLNELFGHPAQPDLYLPEWLTGLINAQDSSYRVIAYIQKSLALSKQEERDLAIYQLVKSMTSPDVNHRFSLEDSIKALKNIIQTLTPEEKAQASRFKQEARNSEVERLNKVYVEAVAHAKLTKQMPPLILTAPKVMMFKRPPRIVTAEESSPNLNKNGSEFRKILPK